MPAIRETREEIWDVTSSASRLDNEEYILFLPIGRSDAVSPFAESSGYSREEIGWYRARTPIMIFPDFSSEWTLEQPVRSRWNKIQLEDVESTIFLNESAESQAFEPGQRSVKAILEKVFQKVRTYFLASSEMLSLAESVIDELYDALAVFPADTSPRLWTGSAEDGAFLIECIYPERRLLFSIEPTAEESSWSFVATGPSGLAMEYGRLSETTVDELIRRYLQ